MTEPRWRRFPSLEALRTSPNKRDDARALPGGDWDFLPVQRAQIFAQFPGMTDQEFRASYFVCDGFCMLCASALDPTTELCYVCHNQTTRKVLP